MAKSVLASDDGLFTLGVEEEFQIVDPVSRELRSHVEQLLEGGTMLLREHLKREMHQSVIECGTKVCKDIREVRAEVTGLRREIAQIAQTNGLRIAASGTHPFSHWMDQDITDQAHYHGLVEHMQQIARANLIFGLHVHVGFPDREAALHVMNAARYMLPHILALSANSPFWLGDDTGYKSFRLKVFERFPRTGLPHHFESISEYDNYIKLLIKTGCMDNPKKIWWDMRLHPIFKTLEFRICDIPMRVDETLALTALIQAVAAKLYRLVKSNLSFRLYRRLLIDENRFRAARYGIHGDMIDFGKQTEVSTRALIFELLEFVDDVVDDLGSRDELKRIEWILDNGTGADRQLEIYKSTNDMKAVVDYIISETHHGL